MNQNRWMLAPLAALALAACSDDDDNNTPITAQSCEAPAAAGGPGGRLLALADADMVATAYTDDQLGSRQDSVSDALLMIDPAAATPAIVANAAAPNAVTGPVWAFDTDARGARAYVVETNARRPADIDTLTGLLQVPADRLSVLDICGARIAPVSETTTARFPTTVSLRADGRVLAVSGREPARVVVHPLAGDGTPGAAVDVALPADVTPRADAPTANQEVIYAGWSPNGQYLAVAVRSTRKLQILRANASGLAFTPLGAAVDIDEGTFGGAWSPDSRFFYLNNVKVATRPLAEIVSGPGAGLTPARLLELLQGSVQVVAVDASAGASVIQTEATPIFPEGIRVSPDGRLLATVNMQTTALPANTPLFSPTSTVSLWTRDAASGRLTKSSDTPFEGILPEGVAFDPSSRYLAVAVYHPTNAERSRGAVDLWEVVGDAQPQLERRQRVDAPRGVHHVQWLR
jgi:6-phosphogluconolactonase (cycloisomerase 2 family)